MDAPRTPRPGSRRGTAERSTGASRRAPRPAGTAPTPALLQEAALTHLARYGTTAAGLLRVLERRVDRWARAATGEAGADATGEAGERVRQAAAASREAAKAVVARLAEVGAVNDAAFAESRGRSLGRAGRSRRAALAHLQARGVDPELARASLPQDGEAELAAAVAHARRRRLGPFAKAPAADPDDPASGEAARDALRRALANLARAGFAHDVASQALRLDRATAEALLLARRRG